MIAIGLWTLLAALMATVLGVWRRRRARRLALALEELRNVRLHDEHVAQYTLCYAVDLVRMEARLESRLPDFPGCGSEVSYELRRNDGVWFERLAPASYEAQAGTRGEALASLVRIGGPATDGLLAQKLRAELASLEQDRRWHPLRAHEAALLERHHQDFLRRFGRRAARVWREVEQGVARREAPPLAS